MAGESASNGDGLRASGVAKTYATLAGPVEVLRAVDLALGPGEAIAVLGPSGSGKSTLLHIVGTLEPPDRGTVRIGGADPFALEETALARFRNQSIGFVFQDHHLLPQYTVLENATLPGLAFGKGDAARARELLARVGLGDRLSHLPAELSGGERQRVAIARALVNRPSLLLCDEPTGNLDAAAAGAVADLLQELHQQDRSILMVVTHSLELAARFGRRLELRDGRCCEA